MEVRIECDNDEGINAMGMADLHSLPQKDDTIVIDGLTFRVVGRRFHSDVVATEFDSVVVILHRENG
ncbi:MAG: hypothetical protein KDN19_02180 [Verrucomicrobiae bacterium]|nr:hypothetical protein [Verrucomicrobiae bacterium]